MDLSRDGGAIQEENMASSITGGEGLLQEQPTPGLASALRSLLETEDSSRTQSTSFPLAPTFSPQHTSPKYPTAHRPTSPTRRGLLGLSVHGAGLLASGFVLCSFRETSVEE